jgi:hypothetical protein
MNVVIYMPKHQQGVELKEQGIKERRRSGLGPRLQTGPRTGQINKRKQGNNFQNISRASQARQIL